MDDGGELDEVGPLEEVGEDAGVSEVDGLLEGVPGRLALKMAATAPVPATPKPIRIQRL